VELIGCYLAACLLLIGAGAAKAVRPTDTARAVTALVPAPLGAVRAVVRAGAAVEAVVGTAGLVHPSPLTASFVVASYAGFALFVVVVLVRGGPLASCGCFGTPDTPATRLHVVVDAALAASAAAVAVQVPSGWLPTVLAGQPWRGIPLLLLAAVCAGLAYLALARLAELGAARRLLGITRDHAA
jgi:hypothetical protein